MKRWVHLAVGALSLGIAAGATAGETKPSKPARLAAKVATGQAGPKAPIRFPFDLSPRATVDQVKRLSRSPEECSAGLAPYVGPGCRLERADLQIRYDSFRSEIIDIDFGNDTKLNHHLASVTFTQIAPNCTQAQLAFQAVQRLMLERYGDDLLEKRSEGFTEEGSCDSRDSTWLQRSDSWWEISARFMPTRSSTFVISLTITYLPHQEADTRASEYHFQKSKKEALQKL